MPLPAHWPSRRLVDEIAELLRERILEGRHAPGAPLSQRRLADELSVSRSVVGEALRVLQREGLVAVAPPGRGMRVVQDDRSILLAAYALREVIDGLAARLAASHAGSSLEHVLRTALDEQRAAVETDERRRYMRANTSFHASVIEGSGNQLLPAEMRLVRCTARSAMLLDRTRLAAALDEHEAIIGAVCGHEPDEAELLARAHVRATVAALEGLATPHVAT